MNVAPKETGSKRQAGWVDHGLSLEVRDPTPFEDASNFWRASAQAATIVMCVLMFGVLLYLARADPAPALRLRGRPDAGPADQDRRTPRRPSLGDGDIAGRADDCRRQHRDRRAGRAGDRADPPGPGVGAAFAEKLHIFDRPVAALNELQTALGINTADQSLSLKPGRIVEAIVTTVTPAALQFILAVMLFLATLFFFILGRANFRNYTINWFAGREARLRALKIMNDIESNLGGYLIVVTAINLSLGIATTIMAYLMGLPSPILWGALAFVLNYIPYVGPAIMDVLLFGIGLLIFPTLFGALLPPRYSWLSRWSRANSSRRRSSVGACSIYIRSRSS